MSLLQETYEARDRKRMAANVMHMEPQGQFAHEMAAQGYIWSVEVSVSTRICSYKGSWKCLKLLRTEMWNKFYSEVRLKEQLHMIENIVIKPGMVSSLCDIIVYLPELFDAETAVINKAVEG